MTLSSDRLAPRGLDAMLIVYSLLDDHPASAVCESFIRERTHWLTTTLTLFEAKAILTKVYAVDATLASQRLSQFSAGPIDIRIINRPPKISGRKRAAEVTCPNRIH
jgi:predicted nucleic acid-binding protein